MKNSFAVILIFVISALLLFGCIESKPLWEESSDLNQTKELESNLLPTKEVSEEYADLNAEIILSVSTDKNEYGSHEEAIITVAAMVSENIEGVTVKVWGITPYSKNYIESEKIVDLIEGENLIEFVEITPYCTAGCGGVYPGPYDLHALIELNGKEIAKTKTSIILSSH